MRRLQHLRGDGDARSGSRLKILLIDDNESEAALVKEAFSALRLNHDLQILHDSDEALALLSKAERHRLPALILLDVQMPKRDGFEILAAIRTNPSLRAIPVIMLSSSDNAENVYRAYECGANAF